MRAYGLMWSEGVSFGFTRRTGSTNDEKETEEAKEGEREREKQR